MACTPTNVVPYTQVNSGTQQQTTIATAAQDNTVVLSPTPASGGSWSWSGPNSFTSASREITLSNIQLSQGGVYIATYTDTNGCVSAGQTFYVSITSLVQSIVVTGTNNATTIDQESGTLQLIATVSPSNASNTAVTWSIPNNTGIATISSAGLLTAYDDGTVTIRATAKDGSGVYGEITITITNQTVTGIQEDIDARFGIYPNPVSSKVAVDNAAGVKQVILEDVNGRILKSISNDQSSMSISMEELPVGIYIMQIVDQKNVAHYKRLVKK